ncbi:MAG: acylase [Acidobacteria bacterium]|nr:acylase [Acidobacteriota bacterium]
MNRSPAISPRLNFLVVLISLLAWLPATAADRTEAARWEQQAANVSIVRDDWGIAHVTGKTDADAVFGMLYAQAEDDFNRIETNYLNALGRLAEAEGEAAVWSDLRMKMFVDPVDLKKKFAASPARLRKLMTAWADGLNYYLLKHPETRPRVITRFEPWMALSFTEGSIGGDIESINLAQLQSFYGERPVVSLAEPDFPPEPQGSNGIAIAPKNTTAGRALLLINPHTSFFFRSEMQVTSGEGLNAYGAATWGQIFIYQGFNERVGWMHTSSAADAIDEWRETITKKGDRYFYKYGRGERPVQSSTIRVPYKTPTGTAERAFTVYRTHHGPVVRRGGKPDEWITVGLMNEPVKALTQSFTRTKARNYKEFRQSFELHTNSSNNTIYADSDGNIAYFHANFIPRRNPKFDWTEPVDGSDPETDWRGLLTFDESPNLLNPATGWVYNSNNSPWSAAGPNSLKQADFPRYVDNGIESARGLHAIRVLENRRDFTPDRLRDAAYDSYLPWFEKTVPALVKAWDELPETDPSKAGLREQIGVLRAWDLRWSTDSAATSLAVFWALEILRTVGRSRDIPSQDIVAAKASPARMLDALSRASERLAADFGNWRTPWGEINRFQRLSGDIVQPFSDAGPSLPVGFTSGNWGSLASFGAMPTRATKKWYGTNGNSFVAVVEFGKKVRARAVTAGGESGDPKSKHFNDQAARYTTGNLRDVYFYPEDLKNHIESRYKP